MKNLLIVAVCLVMSSFAFADRLTVSIVGIEYAVSEENCPYPDKKCADIIVNNFSKILETAIVKTNKTVVYEREQLEPILSEQIAGQAGLTDREGEIGNFKSANYIVSGSITKFGAKQNSSEIPGEVLQIFNVVGTENIFSKGIKQDRYTHEMAVDIKIIDVSTSQILVADTVEAAIIISESSNIGGAHSGETPGDYLSDVQREVARKIAKLIVTQKFPIRVVKVNDKNIVLNYNDSVLSKDECLNLYSLGEDIMDPDTNESLGAEEVLVGEISVVETNSKFSKAKIIGDFTAKEDMIARKTCSTEEEYTTTNKRDDRRGTWDK